MVSFHEISRLVRQVQNELDTPKGKDPDYMLWRLVDAAGLVSEMASHNAMGQTKNPTARGYYIGR